MPRRKLMPDLEQVERLAATGATMEAIARILGMSDRTLYERKRESAEVSAAYARGRAKAQAAYANALREIALQRGPDGEYVYEARERFAAIKFFLERQPGWIKEHRVDMQSSDGSMSPSKIDLGNRTTEELMALTQQAWATGTGGLSGSEGGEPGAGS